MNVADLTQDEMLSANGGNFNCWGGGFLLAAGVLTANVEAVVFGICFIADYC